MAVVFEAGYTLPGADEPLTHARIAHSGNWLSGGTVTASTTATDFFAAAPNNSLTYEKWQPTASPATWEYDHGSAVETDYCVIGAHNLGAVSATVNVQAEIAAVWTTLVSVSPTTDEPIFAIFEPRTQQAWRLSITYAGTAPTIGVIKFGKAMQMQRTIYGGHSPLDMARQTVLRSTYSETGEFLGRTKQRTYNQTSFGFDNLTAQWVRDNWRPFQRAMEAEPFFIAWRPATWPEVGLCQVDSVPVPSNAGVRDLMSVDMNVRALGYD